MTESEPDAAELRALHEEVVAGRDPTSSARMAELLLPALRRRFAGTNLPDPHAVDSLVGWSIARYLHQPDRWDPDKGPLLAYLWRDVSGDINNERDSRTRLRRHEAPDSSAVELVGSDRNLNVEEEVLDDMDPFDVAPEVLDRARMEIARFSDLDRQLIELLGAGVRNTAPYAEILGIGHLPDKAQAREVKRHKDRLNKRLGVIRGRLDATP